MNTSDLPARNVLHVFLASPSDLTDERRMARDVVDEVNRYAQQLELEISLLGWEDTLPGCGRPQELINQDVDRCQVFIGLLWQRWGQPTGVEQFTSGFDEEFQRALNRYGSTGSPEVWLFFKNIEPDRLQDPGEQPKMVLTFRKTVEASKRFLYKEFESTQDWERKIRDALMRYVLALGKQSGAKVQDVASSQPPIADQRKTLRPDSSLAPPADKRPAVEQIKELLAKIGFLLQPAEDGYLDGFEVARLALLSSSFLYFRYENEFLGIHAANALYEYKEKAAITRAEEHVILRSVLADQYDAVPGWYWFRDLDPQTATDSICSIAKDDRSEALRSRVLDMVGKYPSLFPAEQLRMPDVASEVSTESSDLVRTAYLRFLGRTGSKSDLALLMNFTADTALYVEVLHARLRILLRADPDRALTEILQVGEEYRTIEIPELKSKVSSVQTGTLIAGLETTTSWLREAIVEELAARGQLSLDRARSMLADDSMKIRAASLRALINKGENITPEQIRKILNRSDPPGLFGFPETSSIVDPEEILLWQMESLPYEEIRKLVGWYRLEGTLAYRALALWHFDRFGDRVRLDLADGFEVMRGESRADMEKEFGSAAREYLEQRETNVDEFIRNQFIAAGLAGIARNGDAEDVGLARRYLLKDFTDIQNEAIRIVERFGDGSDVESLLTISHTSYGETKIRAAQAAANLSPAIGGAVGTLLRSGNDQLVKIALIALKGRKEEKVRTAIQPLISDPNPGTRVMALAWMSTSYTTQELEEFLENYPRRDTYYYNIVCWLDRFVYCPIPVKSIFIDQLSESLAT